MSMGGTANVQRYVSFGDNVSGDDELRICGDVRGKRVIELGVHGSVPNSVVMAMRGARSISVDPSPENIRRARQSASEAEVVVEFHESPVADLGFCMNAVVDLALCVHQIDTDTDIARLFRQVHRVLKPEAGFVFAVRHPMSAVFDGADNVARRPYGSTSPTIGDYTMSLQRANFTIDTLYELNPRNNPRAVAPAVLVVRARKLGS